MGNKKISTSDRSGVRRRRTVFRAIMITIAGLAIGLGVYSWNARRLGRNQLPMPLGFGMSVVLTGSMEPTLSPGDLVFVVPAASAEDYSVGEIIVFQEADTLVIHRIVAVTDDEYITQGDANNTCDDPVPASKVKGRMSFSVPFLGNVVNWISSAPGVIIIAGLAVFLMIRSWQTEKRADQAKMEELRSEILKLRQQEMESVPAESESSEAGLTESDGGESVSAESED